MTPGAKIGWGIALVILGLLLLVPVWPLALLLLLIGGLFFWRGLEQGKQPQWQIRRLLRQAEQNPGSASALLEQALAIDSNNPEALAASANHAFQNEDWGRASELYERYLLKAPGDEQAEFHLGLSSLNGGNLDKALEHLEPIRAKSDPSSRPGLVNAVAVAFLRKGDNSQALEILKMLPLRRQNLDEQLQQGLFLRSLAHYGLHQTSTALSDLDRLYALNPAFPGLLSARDAMKAGTFTVTAIHFQAG